MARMRASTRLSGTPSSSSECDASMRLPSSNFGHDFGRAGLDQAVELAVVDGAHDHRQLGPQLLHVVQDLERGRACRRR